MSSAPAAAPTDQGVAPLPGDVAAARRTGQNLLWALVAFAYLWAFPFFPRLNNPNENVRVYMTRALVEYHTLDITRVESEWGWVNDKAKSGKRLFSSKAPGASWMGVPVLAAQTWVWHRLGWSSPSILATTLALRVFAVILPLLTFFWALSRHLRRVSRSAAIANLLLVAVAFGSLIYPYGVQFVGHSLAAAASFGAFMALTPTGAMTANGRRVALGGLLTGVGVLLEYQNVLVAVLLAGYVLTQRPRLLGHFLLGALPAAVLLAVFHTLCFGHPWDFPYGHLENAGFQATDHGRGFYGSSLPSVSALVGVLFLPGFGLLACSPFLVVALVAVIHMIARGPRAEGVLCASVTILLWFFLAGLPNWRGGWSVGPRYITVIVPFLTVALAYSWPRLAARRFAGWVWGLTAGLVVAGVFLNASWAVVYPQTPPQVRNPVFQIVWRLLGDGYAPYSLGYVMGVRGPVALLPVAVAIAGAMVVVLAPAIRRGGELLPDRRALPLAVVVSIIFLVPFALWPTRTSPAERDALRVIKTTWAPVSKRGGG